MVAPGDNRRKARGIKLVITDCDGVLTDNGVYYSERGEEMKRFSIRDGMGVERLRTVVNVEVAIISGEKSGSLIKRAEKLNITELHLGVRDKVKVVDDLVQRMNIALENVAYIGDDTNDVEVMQHVGLSACPTDATSFAKAVADYICRSKGGDGAFRDFAEYIIAAKKSFNKALIGNEDGELTVS
ncbi:MAG: KdsC family phosphatase [Candidatus Zhuqueibacterota bacterium]